MHHHRPDQLATRHVQPHSTPSTPQNDRRKLLASLSEEQSTSDSLRSELAAFTAADPAMYDRKRLAGGVCKDAAYRWTGTWEFDSPVTPRLGPVHVLYIDPRAARESGSPGGFLVLTLTVPTVGRCGGWSYTKGGADYRGAGWIGPSH
jgi:hypothetical protein